MNVCVLTMLLLVPTAPSLLAGQAGATTIDSAGISEAIAIRLIARAASKNSGPLVIDTVGNRWNGLVRATLTRLAPTLVPVMSDSASYHTNHFSAMVSISGPDSATADVAWRGCYPSGILAFTMRKWRVVRDRGAWLVNEDDMVTTGHGSCTQYKSGGAR